MLHRVSGPGIYLSQIFFPCLCLSLPCSFKRNQGSFPNLWHITTPIMESEMFQLLLAPILKSDQTDGTSIPEPMASAGLR